MVWVWVRVLFEVFLRIVFCGFAGWKKVGKDGMFFLVWQWFVGKKRWMLRGAIAFLVLVVPVYGAPLSSQQLKRLAVESQRDGIPSGWCGRAMFSLLNKAGLGEGLQSGNGQDWEEILARAGWRPVRVASPEKAPLGSVLVYSSDRRVGKRPRGSRGSYYGHVEMVALGPDGGRLYVADSPRVKPGGSVPDNFTGRAWLPPQVMARGGRVTFEDSVVSVMRERRNMAFRYFGEVTDYASNQRRGAVEAQE